MDNIDAIFRIEFAIRQINSTLDQVTRWMAGMEPSMAEVSFEDRIKLAVNFFVANHAHLMLHADYLKLVQTVQKLTRDHAEFITGGCAGTTANMREDARRVINGLADILDGIGYPGITAAKLRTLPGMD